MKLDTKKVSIKWRLFIYFAIFAGIVLAFLWIFQIVFLDDFYKTIKVGEIKSSGDQIALGVNDASLQSDIESVAQNSDVNILVSNMTTGVTYESAAVPGNFLRNLTEDEKNQLFKRAQDNGGEYLERYFRNQGPRGIEFQNNQNDAQAGVQNGGWSTANVGLSASQSPDAGQTAQPSQTGANNDALIGPQASGIPAAANGNAPQAYGMGGGSPQMDAESMIYAKIVQNSQGETVLVLLSTVISPVNATVQTLWTQLIIITAIMLALAVGIAPDHFQSDIQAHCKD